MSKPPVFIFSNAAKLMLLGSYATGSVVSSAVGTTPPLTYAPPDRTVVFLLSVTGFINSGAS
jgi:hypothetical protein